MVYDLSDPCINFEDYEVQDWTCSEFGHLQGKEELPLNAPKPRGLRVYVHSKVDANHASDTVSRRSRTGFFVWINSALVY